MADLTVQIPEEMQTSLPKDKRALLAPWSVWDTIVNKVPEPLDTFIILGVLAAMIVGCIATITIAVGAANPWLLIPSLYATSILPGVLINENLVKKKPLHFAKSRELAWQKKCEKMVEDHFSDKTRQTLRTELAKVKEINTVSEYEHFQKKIAATYENLEQKQKLQVAILQLPLNTDERKAVETAIANLDAKQAKLEEEAVSRRKGFEDAKTEAAELARQKQVEQIMQISTRINATRELEAGLDNRK